MEINEIGPIFRVVSGDRMCLLHPNVELLSSTIWVNMLVCYWKDLMKNLLQHALNLPIFYNPTCVTVGR